MASYSADTLEYGYRIHGSRYYIAERNPDLDIEITADTLSYGYEIKPDWSEDGDGTFYRGIGQGSLSYGYDILGEYISSPVRSATTLSYSYSISGSLIRIPGGGPISAIKIPRAKWSQIGRFDFTQDKTNIAGDIPLDHPGTICKFLQLSDSIVAYSTGGIVQLVPAKHGGYGKAKVSDIGVLSGWAVTGNTRVHFFINASYELCKLSSEGLEMLGYQSIMESLASESEVVLSIDIYNETLHICNDLTGYVYSILDKSMTTGPGSITSIVPFGGYAKFALTSNPYSISIPDFNIKTDLIDFGTRKFKTIHEIELGIYSSETYTGSQLQVRVHSRQHMVYNEALSTTPWFYVDQDGVATCRCFGREFQFELYCADNDANFKLDWIRIKGFIHDYEPRDS